MNTIYNLVKNNKIFRNITKKFKIYTVKPIKYYQKNIKT